VATRVAEPARHVRDRGGLGHLRVLATNVMVAMRTITVERGYDPREFTLVPFGGMGPTIAGCVAPSSASAAFSSRAIPARSAPTACW
jgi:N-methylhydantoinase A